MKKKKKRRRRRRKRRKRKRKEEKKRCCLGTKLLADLLLIDYLSLLLKPMYFTNQPLYQGYLDKNGLFCELSAFPAEQA